MTKEIDRRIEEMIDRFGKNRKVEMPVRDKGYTLHGNYSTSSSEGNDCSRVSRLSIEGWADKEGTTTLMVIDEIDKVVYHSVNGTEYLSDPEKANEVLDRLYKSKA